VTSRLTLLLLVAVPSLLSPSRATAQDERAAKAALDQLDYPGAIRAARAALAGRLEGSDRIETYEIMGFAYGALDSARQATAAFKEMIFLAPDHELDANTVSPKITALYSAALSQVLVVRKVKLDSAAFIAGSGGATLHFAVTRPARVVTRAFGPGGDMRVDSSLVNSAGVVTWHALTSDGRPLPPGRYRLVITANEGPNEFAAQVTADLIRGNADTLPHFTSVLGYSELPEEVAPEQSFHPLGLVGLFAGAAAAESFVLENPSIGGHERAQISLVAAAALAVGVVASLAKPDPRPVEANIRYNRLLRDQLAQRNADIVARNDALRRQVRLTVRPVTGAP
jgi:hypothetical protein